MHKRVLAPFFKVDASRNSSSKRGFGLGLSIVEDIVKSHGGDLSLRDRQPRGLEVRIVLPGFNTGTRTSRVASHSGNDPRTGFGSLSRTYNLTKLNISERGNFLSFGQPRRYAS